jgi:thymidylate kinase
MIDPKRFGINHSFAILNLIFKFLPKPDVVFFINSSAKNILNRSTELSKKILSKNITNYENFSKKNKFIFNLKSNKSVNKVNEVILSKTYEELNLQTKKIFINLK